MKISYAITVCNEHEEVKSLVYYLANFLDHNDQICILCDSKGEIEKIKSGIPLGGSRIKFETYSFNNNFADLKNYINSMCDGEYIFQIDADEIPSQHLLQNIKPLLYSNPKVDLFWVPRENYVENIQPEHLKLWGWTMDEKQRINYPDYQGRIYKNKETIRWEGKVHETIKGSTGDMMLPPNSPLFLSHKKDIQKQQQQNTFYEHL